MAMIDRMPYEDNTKDFAYLEIDNVIISMSNEITRHKKRIVNGTTNRVMEATTSTEKTADAIMIDQGILHAFNVEYKCYQCAVANEQYAQSRLHHATSELNVAESKMHYILKMIRDKKIDITIKK